MAYDDPFGNDDIGFVAPPAFHESVMWAESGGDPYALSPKGAVGRMQTMRETLRDPGYGVAPARDDTPDEWERVGHDYLDAMWKEYDEDPVAALVAYNWGPGNANEWIRGGRNPDELPRETRDYIERVMDRYAGGQEEDAISSWQEAAQLEFGEGERGQESMPAFEGDWREAAGIEVDPEEAEAARSRLDQILAQNAKPAPEEAQPVEEEGSFLGDIAKGFRVGANEMTANVFELIRQIPGADRIAALDRTIEGLQDDSQAVRETMTADTQAAMEKDWWDEEKGTFGKAWSDPKAYAMGIVTSLPEELMTMIPAMRIAKGAYAAKIAAGAGKEAAAVASARAATLAGSIGEGLMGGAASAREVREKIQSLPDEALAETEFGQAALAAGMSLDEAREHAANDQSTQAFLTAGAVTGLFGGLGDRALAEVAAGGLKGMVKRAARSAVAEGGEEFAQGIGQQAAENVATESPVMEGALNEALGGMATGAIQGGAMGAVTRGPTSPMETEQPEEIAARVMDTGSIEETIQAANQEVDTAPAGGVVAPKPAPVVEPEAPQEVAGMEVVPTDSAGNEITEPYWELPNGQVIQQSAMEELAMTPEELELAGGVFKQPGQPAPGDMPINTTEAPTQMLEAPVVAPEVSEQAPVVSDVMEQEPGFESAPVQMEEPPPNTAMRDALLQARQTVPDSAPVAQAVDKVVQEDSQFAEMEQFRQQELAQGQQEAEQTLEELGVIVKPEESEGIRQQLLSRGVKPEVVQEVMDDFEGKEPTIGNPTVEQQPAQTWTGYLESKGITPSEVKVNTDQWVKLREEFKQQGGTPPKPLKDIKVEVRAMDDEGNEVVYDDDAETALKDVDDRLDVARKLLECLGS